MHLTHVKSVVISQRCRSYDRKHRTYVYTLIFALLIVGVVEFTCIVCVDVLQQCPNGKLYGKLRKWENGKC